MKKIILPLLLIFPGFETVNALTPVEIVNIHSIKPYAKAKQQWVRVFKKERKLKKYGLNKYSKQEKLDLLKYLIKNAADADNPNIPGL